MNAMFKVNYMHSSLTSHNIFNLYILRQRLQNEKSANETLCKQLRYILVKPNQSNSPETKKSIETN